VVNAMIIYKMILRQWILQQQQCNSKGIKFEMKWAVDLDPGWLPDNRKTLQLCRESFYFLDGFSPKLIKKTSKKIKSIMSADLSSLKTEAQYNHRSYFGDDFYN
jgi:hypothetical protein